MKAIVYEGFKNVNVTEVPDPKLEENDDIIVRVTSTSICGSDLHLIHGMVPSLEKGYIIGHEAIGIVEEIGDDVHKLKKGDRVIIPFPAACGHCAYCEHDLFTQCDSSNDYGETGGILGYGKAFGNYSGAQAEYIRVPYANFGPKIIPDHFEDEQVLFLGDILPTAYFGVINGGVKNGDTVVILGCGPVGLLTIKFAILFGAKRVITVDCLDYRLNHAKKYGVETININDYDDTGAYIKELTHGGADVIIDCVGMEGKMSALDLVQTALRIQGGTKAALVIASRAVRKGGTVSILGVYGAKYNGFPLGEFFSRNITLKMGLCPAQLYIEPILKLIEKNKIDATDIITHKLSLDKGKYAYEIFDEKKDDCIKVILKP